MADRVARLNAIRDLSKQIAVLVSKQRRQPKYDSHKVGPDLDQYGLPKDRNTVIRISLDNFDKAQKAGVVVDQPVWAFLPQAVDNMCRLATDEEILEALAGQRLNFEEADRQELLGNRGRYANGRGATESSEIITRHSPAFKVLKEEGELAGGSKKEK